VPGLDQYDVTCLSSAISDDYAMVLRATNVYIGTMTDISFGLNEVPSHDLVNLRAGLISDRKVSVSLFINNITISVPTGRPAGDIVLRPDAESGHDQSAADDWA